jgi:hypothetical protein
MSFVTDLIDHATGASAMNEATDMQRDEFNYWKGLSEEDRKAMLGIFDEAERGGFFDWRKRLDMYDKAVSPANDRDMRNVGVALRTAGSRPGDTNTDAATAMVLNAQKSQRGEQAMKFFENGFKDRFAMRSAIGGNTNALMSHASDTLSQTLMGQGQQQAGNFGLFTQAISPFVFGKPGGGGAGGGGGGTNITPGSLGNLRPQAGPMPQPNQMASPGAEGAFRPSFFADTQKWLS